MDDLSSTSQGRNVFFQLDGYLDISKINHQNIDAATSAISDIPNKIIFHPNLNVILVFTNSVILTLDVNSGVVLQRVPASG